MKTGFKHNTNELLSEVLHGNILVQTFSPFHNERRTVQISFDKFLIEKSFQNTILGRQQMSDFIEKFKKESNIKKYFKQ